MTNLNGFLVKVISLFSVFLSFSLISSPVQALTTTSSITSTSQLEYRIEDNGDLDGVVRVTLDSASSISEVLNYYTLVLPFPELEVSRVTSGTKDYAFTQHPQTNGTDVVINFGEEYVSKTSYFTFDIYFISAEYFGVSELGGRNVSVPTALPGHTISKVTLITPDYWGDVNWASEKEYVQQSNVLTINSPTKERLSVIWGETISYSFEINKSYANYGDSALLYDLYVPNDGRNQQVLFSEISPAPYGTSVDRNGNTKLSFFVKASETIEISVYGEVLMLEISSSASYDQLEALTSSQKYWELTDDDLITEIKIALKGNGISDTVTSITDLSETSQRETLYKSLYQYIIDSHELAATKDLQVVISARRGATNALNSDEAVSVEDYADSLVAVLRHYNIPAVVASGYIPEVAGYKSEGFFHTWAEYWNSDSARWVVLDPALEELTGQSLYSEEHNDHILFTLKGDSSLKPNISYFADEELQISLTPTPSDSSSRVKVAVIESNGKIWEGDVPVLVQITNVGNRVVEITGVSIIGVKDHTISKSIAPGQVIEIWIDIPNIDYEELEVSAKDSSGSIASSSFEVTHEELWWWTPLLYIILAVVSLGVSLGLVKGIKVIRNKKWK